VNDPHVQTSLERVAAAMEKHSRAVVGFSGGKESLVLKHLLQPWADRLEYVWVNTGAMLPHMREFILGHGVTEVMSDQGERFRRVGLPSRIVPIFNTPLGVMTQSTPERLMLTDWVNCCAALRTQPLINAARIRGLTLYVHGQRLADGVLLTTPGDLESLDALREWSEAQVYEYIQRNEVALPPQYLAGYRDSGECWNCTSELDVNRFRYLAAEYPQLWARLKPSLQQVYGAVFGEWSKHKASLDLAFQADPSERVETQ
jgi:3'-phosphoadenosine 5'-phosphosulfate sulfotransferase (PAPS reductase)/FAD synthetase